jgi:hypothetical protein
VIFKKMLDEYDEIREKMNKVSHELDGKNPRVLENSRRLEEIHNFFLSLRFKGIEKNDLAS